MADHIHAFGEHLVRTDADGMSWETATCKDCGETHSVYPCGWWNEVQERLMSEDSKVRGRAHFRSGMVLNG